MTGDERDGDGFEDMNAVENVLRGLIESVLAEKRGDDWISDCGCSAERVEKWKEKRDADRKKREGAIVSDNLIFYADFYDLSTIIGKHWDEFSPALGDKKTFMVYMDRLEDFRNPKFHGRSLLQFERALIKGMAGEIRNKVTIYKSGQGPTREYFPRIESIQDSFGNRAPSRTGLILNPGDEVRFDLTSWDPEGDEVLWQVLASPNPRAITDWFKGSTWLWSVTEQDIADPRDLVFVMKSDRQYHRMGNHDDEKVMSYRVLPTG